MTVIIPITSDHHAGSTVALCPPVVELDDGGAYHASLAQRWIWQCWHDYWGEVRRLRDQRKATLINAFNGDMVEGDHHGTGQIISRIPGTEFAVARAVFEVPQSLAPDHTFVVRGTETHVGKNASMEEGLAKHLNAEPDPDNGTASWWHLRMEQEGVLLDMAHHGRMGTRPWTEVNVVANLAAEIFYEHARRGRRHPDIAIRSHLHRHKDTHDAHPVRVIQTPAWQLKTGHVHKKHPESIADIGGIILIIEDGLVTVRNVMFLPKQGAIWTGSK